MTSNVAFLLSLCQDEIELSIENGGSISLDGDMRLYVSRASLPALILSRGTILHGKS